MKYSLCYEAIDGACMTWREIPESEARELILKWNGYITNNQIIGIHYADDGVSHISCRYGLDGFVHDLDKLVKDLHDDLHGDITLEEIYDDLLEDLKSIVKRME